MKERLNSSLVFAWALVALVLAHVLMMVGERVGKINPDDVGAAVHNIATATYNLSAASNHADQLVTRVDEASKPVLECKGNGACLPVKILATTGAIAKMAGEGAKAAPKISESIQNTANNVQVLTSNLTKTGDVVSTQITAVGGAAVGLRTDLKPSLDASAKLFVNLDADMSRLTEPAEGTLKAVRSSAEGFQNFLPILQTQVVTFTTKANETADHISALTKPHWYDRGIGYGLAAMTFYRDLNPGYNLGQGIRGLVTKKKEQ